MLVKMPESGLRMTGYARSGGYGTPGRNAETAAASRAACRCTPASHVMGVVASGISTAASILSRCFGKCEALGLTRFGFAVLWGDLCAHGAAYPLASRSDRSLGIGGLSIPWLLPHVSAEATV